MCQGLDHAEDLGGGQRSVVAWLKSMISGGQFKSAFKIHSCVNYLEPMIALNEGSTRKGEHDSILNAIDLNRVRRAQPQDFRPQAQDRILMWFGLAPSCRCQWVVDR